MHKVRGLGWLAILAVLCTSARGEESFPWQPTLENAQRVASQTNRLVLVLFSAPWCDACRRMERDVFGQPNVAASLQSNFVPVKINADHFPTTARRMGVTALPTTVIITPSGQQLLTIRGRRQAGEYIAGLNQIAASARQNLVQQQNRRPVAPPAVAQPPAAPPNGGVAAAIPPTTHQPQNTQPQNAPADRYADYHKRNPAVGATAAPRYGDRGYGDRAPAAGPAGNPATGTNNLGQPVQPPLQPAGSDALSYLPQGIPDAGQQTPQPPAVGPENGNPPLCLDGYCPVSLVDTMVSNVEADKRKWVLGVRQWGAIHRGRTYLFAGQEQQARFLADPDRYAPVMSGNDIVLTVDQGETVSGRRDFGVFFGGHTYLFASKDSRHRFEQDPDRYANEVLQAMHADRQSCVQ